MSRRQAQLVSDPDAGEAMIVPFLAGTQNGVHATNCQGDELGVALMWRLSISLQPLSSDCSKRDV